MSGQFELPVCRHRGVAVAAGRWQCGSPLVVAPGGHVTAYMCRRECAHVDHEAVPLGAKVTDSAAGLRRPVASIAVQAPKARVCIGMLTAPRPLPTVTDSIASLRMAGFDADIHLFEEPGCSDRGNDDASGVIRHPNEIRLGSWQNWRHAAQWLLDHNDSDYVIVCEDDIGLSADAAVALDHALATTSVDDMGYVSLFTPWHNVIGKRVVQGWQSLAVGRQTWGALFYCLPRKNLVSLLEATANLSAKPTRFTDGVLSEACANLGLRCYFHFPSLCEHRGRENSAIGHILSYEAEACGFGSTATSYVRETPDLVQAPKTNLPPKRDANNQFAPDGPVRVAIAAPALIVGGAEQWMASLSHWLDPNRAVVTKVIVLWPNAIDRLAQSWFPSTVEIVSSRHIQQDGKFDLLLTWGLLNLVQRISQVTCPTIDVQHGVITSHNGQHAYVASATRARELFGTTLVGVNEAVRRGFPEHIRDEIIVIPNGCDPRRVLPLRDPRDLKASIGLSPQHKVVVYIGRISAEKNVQTLIDSVEHLDESWHAVIVGPRYVPLERIGPRIHLLPSQSHVGDWLGIADVLCQPSDYESHCLSINEAWFAGVPVVSCDYLVNRLYEERHGQLMWLVPTRPEPRILAQAIMEAHAGRSDPRVGRARETSMLEYTAPIMGRRWSDLVAAVARRSGGP